VSAYIAAAAAHQDAMDRLRELGDRLEDEYGSVTAEEERAAGRPGAGQVGGGRVEPAEVTWNLLEQWQLPPRGSRP
jgi:hypothetical protein